MEKRKTNIFNRPVRHAGAERRVDEVRLPYRVAVSEIAGMRVQRIGERMAADVGHGVGVRRRLDEREPHFAAQHVAAVLAVV